jgi:DNA-binding transcriptional regulator YdaS (Cro superfamily)
MVDWKANLKRAVALVGSQAKLAAEMTRCGSESSQSKISWLLVSAEQISAEDALAIHRATEGRVPACELRPDLWPTPDHVPQEPAQAS